MREAPWVLSDVLRAKRKNGVEGRKEKDRDGFVERIREGTG